MFLVFLVSSRGMFYIFFSFIDLLYGYIPPPKKKQKQQMKQRKKREPVYVYIYIYTYKNIYKYIFIDL